ncbi:MAG: DNA-directed RNA polymerase subunit B, partial [Candidatus Heimdallarchaeaceae archaeon]
MADVYINEKLIGHVEDPKEFVMKIRKERRLGKLPDALNILYDRKQDEILIETSKGRARRPLIVVENGKPKLTPEIIEQLKNNEITWKDLVNKGIIEYIDAMEEESCLVALTPEELTEKHTHLEISPAAMVGITTSLVPYANHLPSSRLIRGGSKAYKQGIGLYASNYLLRMDTDISVLQYPQSPLVRTFTHEISKYEKHPVGQNIVVAVMSNEGFNMQDAIVLNKGSIERGLGRSFYFRPYELEEIRYPGGLVDEIGIPDKEVKGYKSEYDYRLLEKDGVVYPEAYVTADDVLIGKTSPPRFLGELEEFSLAANIRRESSITVRQGEKGVVDFVVLTENEEGNRIVRLRLRDLRIPEPGDKFTSRHGQKGVIGAIIPQADMPFTASGIVPDLIFSPHGLPSRMTLSHMIELLAGKVAALSGRYVDGTIFFSEPVEDLRKQLKELGFRENGTERLYNGKTGEEYIADIFIGNMYYFKLKYMAANKLHARATGRVQLLTRQPIEGRSKGGGLRLGEMEKDCLVGHGTSLLLKERFDSDKTIIYICEECGMFAVYDEYRNKKFCPKCGSNVEITPIELSYAFKLLLDELKSL